MEERVSEKICEHKAYFRALKWLIIFLCEAEIKDALLGLNVQDVASWKKPRSECNVPRFQNKHFTI